MRKPFALLLVLGLSSFASSQEGKPKTPEETPPRFGVAYKGRVYLQATPKDALNSLIETADKGEFSYLVAHLLDPAFVDARVSDRAKQFEPTVSANLATLRDFQQKNLDKVDKAARIPVDAAQFQERVLIDAKAAAFKQLVKDVQDKFTEDPEVLKSMRLFRSGGNFPEMPGEVAKIGHPDVKNQSLFIRKLSDRYYIENRQADAPEPPKEPEKK